MKIRLSKLFAAPELPPALQILQTLMRSSSIGDAETIAFLQFAMTQCGMSHSQAMQDVWALFELREKRNGYFVEFGAANGVDFSNTYLLAEQYGWRGVLAEAHPTFISQLRVNRPHDYISDKAVWSASGKTLDFAMTRVPLLSVLVDAKPPRLGSRKALQHTRIKVETISLNDLLTEAGAPVDIDFISVDVEGGELQVLEKFDFGKWRVKLFTIELNRAADEIDALLAANGYQRRFPQLSQGDGWYLRD